MFRAGRSIPATLDGLLNRKDRRLSSTRRSTSCAKALAEYLAHSWARQSCKTHVA
jgi:hypothetical protein